MNQTNSQNQTSCDKQIKVSRTFALVCDFDYDLVAKTKWYLHSRGYAVDRLGNLMHHIVAGKPISGMVIDHINGDKLDNRIWNLRKVTYSKNSKNHIDINQNNTSGFRGVGQRPSGRWYAIIWHNLEKITLGTFDTMEEAIAARVQAEDIYELTIHS